MQLHSRLRERFPHFRPSHIADSAFGSFERLTEIQNSGGDATMSMSSRVKPFWELLDWDCGVGEGRAAYIPDQKIVISSFKVVSERGDWHQIKMISSACDVALAEVEEPLVLRVSDRRHQRGQSQYLTHFSDGTAEWLPPENFIDLDGKTNASWLSFADENDLTTAFSDFTLAELQVGSLLSVRFFKIYIIMGLD